MEQQISSLAAKLDSLFAANDRLLGISNEEEEVELRHLIQFGEAEAALHLIRQNEERLARKLLKALVRQVPTDEATVMLLIDCYDKLKEPDTGYAVLEAACEKPGQAPPSETLLIQLFFVHARKQDHQKQFSTAMKLYKAFKRSIYFAWAISSLLLKSECLGDPSAAGLDPKGAKVQLELAERMFARLMSESGTLDKRSLGLYLETLSRQSKYSRMLDVMKCHGYPWPAWQNNHFHEFYVTALKNLRKGNELMSYLKSAFMKNKEDYGLLKQIVEVSGMGFQGCLELVQPFLDELRAKHPSLVVAMADLRYALKYMPEASSAIRTKEALKMAYKYGSNKPSFYSQISEYLDNVKGSAATMAELLEAWDVQCRKTDVAGSYSYASTDDIIRDVNYELVHRHLVPDTCPFDRLARAHRCLEKYLHCEESVPCIIKGKKRVAVENNPDKDHDWFLIIAVTTLLEKSDDEGHGLSIWGLLRKVRNDVPEWVLSSPFGPAWEKINTNNNETKGTHDTVEGKEESKNPYKYDFNEYEFILMTSILLMEFGLEKSPLNFEFRILLSKAYSQIGAVQRACEMIDGLGPKSVKWDTFSYLVMRRALNGGMYKEAATMMDATKNIYREYRQETPGAVVGAYQSDSFVGLPEFFKLRGARCHPVQYGLILCEDKLLEYMGATSPTQVREIAENLIHEFSTEPMYSKKDGLRLGDNRDFTVLRLLANEDTLMKLKLATYCTDVNLFEIKSETLAIVTNMLSCISDMSDANMMSRKWSSISSSIARVHDCIAAYPTFLKKNDGTTNFYGLWPPRNNYRHKSIMKQFALVIDLAQDLKRPSDVLAQLDKSIKVYFENSMKWLRQIEGDMNLLNVVWIIEGFHVMLEALSISRIVVDVVISLAKIKFERAEESEQDPGNESEFRKACTTGLKTLKAVVADMCQFIDGCKLTFRRLGPFRWHEVNRHWEGLLGGNFLQVVFPRCFDKVQDYISRSYQYQLDGMKQALLKLATYVDELGSPFV